MNTLTQREREILRRIVDGLSNKEIARVEGMAEPTVKTHMRSLTAKTGCKNRTQLAVMAIREGIAA